MKKIWLLPLCILLTFQAQACFNHNPTEAMVEWLSQEKELSKSPHLSGNLATVTLENKPSSRMVNVFWSEQGDLLFYTHSNTQKVSHLARNPNANMNIWLPSTRKQVTVDGEIEPIAASELESNWKKMPRWMQLRFMSSDHHSKVTDHKKSMKQTLADNEKKYPGDIPRPETFIGYKIIPNQITFYEIKMPDFAEKHVARKQAQQWIVAEYQP